MGRRHDEALFARGPLRKASSILKVALPPFSFLRCSGLRTTRFCEFLQHDFETKVPIFPLISVRWFLLSGAVSFAPVLFFAGGREQKSRPGTRSGIGPPRRRSVAGIFDAQPSASGPGRICAAKPPLYRAFRCLYVSLRTEGLKFGSEREAHDNSPSGLRAALSEKTTLNE